VASSWRGGAAKPARHALVELVSRLLLAQAAVTGAIGLAYLRGSLTGLLLIVVLAGALGCLAALVRSGGRGAWLTAAAGEGVIAVTGLVQIITSAQYLGGTLLALVTLAVLLHPAVGAAFGPAPRSGQPGPREARVGEQSLAESAGGAIGGEAG
jgi:hypothetical protein